MRPSCQFMLSMTMMGRKNSVRNAMPCITPVDMKLAQASASTVGP